MRNTLAVLSLTSFLPLTGCMSSLRVQSADRNFSKPKGLPFYAKTGACKQQSIFLENRYEISAKGFKTKVLNEVQYAEAQAAIQNAGSAEALSSATEKLPETSQVSDLNSTAVEQARSLGLIKLSANSGDVAAVVDYTHPMWLNSARPLAGSTQVSAEFNPDGTLTKASGQTEDKTLETITSTITSLASLGAGMRLQGGESFEKTVKKTVILHTHTKYVPLTGSTQDDALANCNAPKNPVYDGSWTVASSDDKPAGDKKNDTSKP